MLHGSSTKREPSKARSNLDAKCSATDASYVNPADAGTEASGDGHGKERPTARSRIVELPHVPVKSGRSSMHEGRPESGCLERAC